MAVYEYKGLTAAGKVVSGVVDADNPKLARQRLRSDGIYPTDVVLEKAHKGSLSQDVSFKSVFQRIGKKEVAVMTRQLSTLLKAGLPLVTCLTAMADQVENPKLVKILTQVRERVNEGNSLANALQEFPKVFTDLYINMVAAGEASGALELVLLRLADFLENQVRLRGRIQAALAYPVIMTLLGLAMLMVLLTVVIPKFVTIFEDLQQTLPLPTRILINASSFFRTYWYLIIMAGAGAIYGILRYKATPKGRRLFDRIFLHIPVFGRLILLGVATRFSRTLGTLLSSGVPLLKAMDIVEKLVNNTVFEEAIRSAREAVVEGAALSRPLKSSGVFPPIMIHMIASGEQSGHLEEMLSKVADMYEEEAETITATLTSLLEPILILGMALMVAFVMVSILLPIFEMNQVITR